MRAPHLEDEHGHDTRLDSVFKPTQSTNLAHALQLAGGQVLLVDADPQGSARDWSEASEGGICPVVGLDRETLARDLPAISENYD